MFYEARKFDNQIKKHLSQMCAWFIFCGLKITEEASSKSYESIFLTRCKYITVQYGTV